VIIVLPLLIVLPDISYKNLGKLGFPTPADKIVTKDEVELQRINQIDKIPS
jgi:hypothetical protein